MGPSSNGVSAVPAATDGAVREHVRMAVAALRDLGRVVATHEPHAAEGDAGSSPDESSVPLAALAFFADALVEQIGRSATPTEGTRSARGSAVPRRIDEAALAEYITRYFSDRLASPSLVSATPADRMRQIIDVHYSEPLTVGTIAARIGCAPSCLSLAFKREFGETPHRYIAKVRIRRAAVLIAQGAKIEAAMLMVGYRGKKNFYRQFQRAFGQTPGRYRERFSNDGGSKQLTLEGMERLYPGPQADVAASALAPCGAHERGAVDPLEAVTPARGQSIGPTVTVPRAVQLLGVSRRTVYYWLRNGTLKSVRLIHGGQRVLVSSFPALDLECRETDASTRR
jgi:excisionase family DNA binding protein